MTGISARPQQLVKVTIDADGKIHTRVGQVTAIGGPSPRLQPVHGRHDRRTPHQPVRRSRPAGSQRPHRHGPSRQSRIDVGAAPAHSAWQCPLRYSSCCSAVTSQPTCHAELRRRGATLDLPAPPQSGRTGRCVRRAGLRRSVQHLPPPDTPAVDRDRVPEGFCECCWSTRCCS